MNQQFRNVVYLSDRSGTGKWRRTWPMQSIDCVAQGLNIQADYSQTPITDRNYYKNMNSVTVQRWISKDQRDIFCKFLKPLMDHEQGWTVYEIDDLMSDGTLVGMSDEEKQKIFEKYGKDLYKQGIPLFNRGRAAFEGEETQSYIRQMLNAADFVTVTTDHIKQLYHDLYGVPLENIIAVPNLLPRYLFGGKYDNERKVDQFRKNKTKPRIGIVSSLSHYNVDGVRVSADGKACRKIKKPDGSEAWIVEGKAEIPYDQTFPITDDIDAIAKCIRDTVNDFMWVFFGFCPPILEDLVKAGKIEVHGGVPIMNYPQKFHDLNLQAVVAAINPAEFNYAKSFIKYMECSAFGVCCFATDCLPYSRVMPKQQLFKNGDELAELLKKLKFMSAGAYSDMIERQWKWLNSPCIEGDFEIRNFWLEDNLNVWINLFRLRPKAIHVSLDFFSKQYDARKEEEKKNTIFKNDSISIMK